MKIKHAGNYIERRRAAYDPVTDQLDAILKGMESRIETLSVEEKEVVRRWRAVKTRHPKPIE